jgi:bifunctional non-homologous end joining protein LigD
MAHSAGIGGVELSHPDKLLFPKDGFTKADLAEYYATVAAFMLPHLADRPITMVRCPGGIGKRCFFQKHPSEGMAESAERIAIAEETGTRDYLIVRDPRDLVELVQFDTIEIHGWGAPRRDLERPDRIIFDLDPGPGVEWSVVVDTAITTRGLLAVLDLESFVQTTGGKGLHVLAPIRPHYTWPTIKSFARSIAEQIAVTAPDRYTTTAAKAARKGRIFIDYLRNARGATAVAPYSVRARAGVPVATPLDWDELPSLTGGSQFTAMNMRDRLSGLREDPWVAVSTTSQGLTARMLAKVGIPVD